MPPPLPGAGACAVCGFALPEGAAACEMCGAPPRPPRPPEEVLRCPFCSREIAPEATRCPHCGVDFLGSDRAAELRIRCPVCESPADADAVTCASCGTTLFAEAEPEAPPPAVVRCPTCGQEATEDDAACARCGRTLWHLVEETWRKLVGEHLEKAAVELHIGETEAWADLDPARALLGYAEAALAAKRFPQALRAAKAAAEAAQGARVQVKIFLDAYRTATARITEARESGADPGSCGTLLELAVGARTRKHFRTAVRMAIRARICAEESVLALSRPRRAD